MRLIDFIPEKETFSDFSGKTPACNIIFLDVFNFSAAQNGNTESIQQTFQIFKRIRLPEESQTNVPLIN